MRALILASAVLSALPASGMELFLRDSIPSNRPSSLAYDSAICSIWVVNESTEVIRLTPGLEEVDRFDTGMTVKTLAVDGDELIVATYGGRFQRFTRDGARIGELETLNPRFMDPEGLHANPDGTLLLAEDDGAHVVHLTPEGEVISRIDGMALEPRMWEPQGVTRDADTGNILVVDDNEGLNALFEFDAGGTLLSVTPLSAYGYDAEGITVMPQTGRMFIGFDGGQRLAVFDYLPTAPDAPQPIDPGPDCAIG